MEQREYIADVIKELLNIKVIAEDGYAIGLSAAAVILGIRKNTCDLDIFVPKKRYTAYVEAGNVAETDKFGEYAPYYDFIRFRQIESEDMSKTVKEYGVTLVHPTKLLSDYQQLVKTEGKTDEDHKRHIAMARDIEQFITRYW